MQKISINGEEYSLPTCWEEVTIAKYKLLQEVFETSKSSEMKIIEMVQVLSACPIDLLRKVRLSDFALLDLSWADKAIETKVDPVMEILGVKYGVTKDLNDLSLGETADLFEYQNSKHIEFITAILMRPVQKQDGDLYIIEDYDEKTLDSRAKIFRDNMNVVQMQSLANFFFHGANGSLKNMNQTLQKKIQKKIQKEKK